MTIKILVCLRQFILTSTFEEVTSKMARTYQCGDCGKHLSSYHSAWRHKKNSCPAKDMKTNTSKSSIENNELNSYQKYQQRVKDPEMSNDNSSSIGIGKSAEQKKPNNPWMSSFINDMVNRKSKADEKIQPNKNFTPLKMQISPFSDENSKRRISVKKRELSPTIAAAAESPMSISQAAKKLKILPEEAVSMHEDTEDEDEDEDNESICIDDLPPPSTSPIIRFLPSDIASLRNQLKKLYNEFMDNDQYQHRNEMVTILDELYRRDDINLKQYQKFNDILSEVDGVGKNSEEEEEETDDEEDQTVHGRTSKTLEHLIKHDRKEIDELLTEFERQKDGYYEEELETLRNLVEKWIEDEVEGEKEEMKDIEKVLTNLQKSKIPRSKLHRVMMILRDIRRNRVRVEDAIELMNVFEHSDSAKQRMDVLNRLMLQKLISYEQYQKLKENIDKLDMDSFITELKTTKIGRGHSFLPTTIRKLKEEVKDSIMGYAEKKSIQLRDKMLALLNELLQRRAISKEEYKDTIEKNDLNE